MPDMTFSIFMSAITGILAAVVTMVITVNVCQSKPFPIKEYKQCQEICTGNQGMAEMLLDGHCKCGNGLSIYY
jgi:hypothetical protein